MTKNNSIAPEPNKPLFATATDPNFNKRMYHEVVPMMMFAQDDRQLYLPLVIVTSRQHTDIEANAYADTKAHFKGIVPKENELSNWNNILDFHRAAWTIYYAARMPDDLSKKFFEHKQQVEDTYTPDELALLMANYISIKRKQPVYKNLDPDSIDPLGDIINQIIKDVENSDFFLNSLTSHAMNQLVKFLVVQHQIYKSTNGSSGLLSNDIIANK